MALNLGNNAFLLDQTLTGLKLMILGYVGLLYYYVLKRGMTIAPRRTLSNVCEHLFSNMRSCAVSTNNVIANSA